MISFYLQFLNSPKYESKRKRVNRKLCAVCLVVHFAFVCSCGEPVGYVYALC